MKRDTFADNEDLICRVDCLLTKSTSKVILQQNPSIVETLNPEHFSSGKVCSTVAEYDAYLLCI